MNTKNTTRVFLVLGICLALVPVVSAAVLTTGNVEPSNPETWTSSDVAYVGNTADGTLVVDGGSSIVSSSSQLGVSSGIYGEATVTGADSTWTSSGSVTVGNGGYGTLNIADGGNVTSNGGNVGTKYQGGWGKATVDGSGSSWTMTNNTLNIGTADSGTVSITNGATVVNNNTVLGAYYTSAARGTVTVAGEGSMWTTRGSFIMSYNAGGGLGGTLNISDGGQVYLSGGYMRLASAGATINVEVSNDDMIYLAGTGYIENNGGTIRLTAKAGLAAGEYTPISAPTWQGTGGTYEIFGGVWDDDAHTFTVAEAEQVVSGQQTQIDLSTKQRIAVGTDLSVNFAPATSETLVDFTATATSGTELTALEALLGAGEVVQGAYDFTISGLSSGDETILNFALTDELTADELTLWHNDGSGWTVYAADVTVSSDWASFSVDSFSSYAVTGIPEPATLSLIVFGGLMMVRRKYKQ